ncbi:transglutaminase-like cysteine peptidase [Caldimonas tepidiphila]|uniref:transglutaminase-like cysteine peptidase n=1 Tax=Caldimonas tepidiphila TaxID=2315841 RepID=UPI001F0CC994|nr:transglutaminase-like cysteine peptidase [Caldimonas tepidiphila]
MLCHVAAALLLLFSVEPQAWDVVRMRAAAQQHGPLAVSGVQALEATLAAARQRPEAERLQIVNRFFNERIRYADDLETTGLADQWASPVELLGRGAGDCEDYSIAKYFSLIAAGVPSARLRLVYVRAEVEGLSVAHMVLAYYAQPSAEPLLLDNLRPEILKASLRPDLRPVFSFSAEGLWQGTGSVTAGNPVERLSRWREVITKTRLEGLM